MPSPKFVATHDADRLALAWPLVSATWPILGRLNGKNGVAFNQAIRGIVQSRMALAKDAKHDFYSIAADDVDTEEGLKRSELWAEAVFFLPAGEITFQYSFFPCSYHASLPPRPSSPEA